MTDEDEYECGYDAGRENGEREVGELRAALVEIERLCLTTEEGTLAKRVDRMWEVACEALGRPVPGARPFLSN